MGPFPFEGLVKKTETGCRPDQLFGAWSVELGRFAAMVERAKAVDLASLPRAEGDVVLDVDAPEAGPLAYKVEGRIAVIEVTGPLTKYQTSFQAITGGTSTVAVRQTLRAVNRDKAVDAIMLRIDSPGGTVAGTMELAEAVRDSKKPASTYIEDLGCSAAYWVAAMGRKAYANAAATIGSIGTFAVLQDTSGMYEAAGVKVHVVSSAPLKGAGVAGTPITAEHLEEVQRQVDGFTELFVKGSAKGRGMPVDQMRQLADGRVHLAAEAKKLGLIDAVASFEDAMKEMRKSMDMEEQLAKAQADLTTLKAVSDGKDARIAALEAEVASSKAAAVAADPRAAWPAEARAAVEKLEADAAATKAAARKKEFEAKIASFKALALPVALAAHLEGLDAVNPEAAAAFEQALRAADEQCEKGKLFGQVGITGGAPTAGTAEARVEARAAALVAEGKAKDLHAAREMAWKENPELWKQHMQERRAS